MSRRIITTQFQGAGNASVDTFLDRVVKYIPADIIAAWTSITGLISSAANVPGQRILWIVFAVGLIVTPLWILKLTAKPDQAPAKTQAIVGTGAFAVWVFALGGPFANLHFYRSLYGSLILIFYTLIVALIEPQE